jgi:ElaB/YqjD/DUF883 family membrane-anchored ribosome-binding protein
MTSTTHNNATDESIHASDTGTRRNGSQHDAAESLKQDLAALVNDAEELLRHSVEAIGTPAITARARLMDSLSRAKARTASGISELRQRGQYAAGMADNYIRERTWQSIGLAALAGLVVGVLVTRRGKNPT